MRRLQAMQLDHGDSPDKHSWLRGCLVSETDQNFSSGACAEPIVELSTTDEINT